MINRYYLTQRGPGPGAIPRYKDNLITDVKDYGIKIFIGVIGCMAWGYVEYEKPLIAKEISDYELAEAKEEIRVPFSEKGITDCTDCCKCCSEFECPANETRCQ